MAISEVIINITDCDECPYMQYVFTEVGLALYNCGLLTKDFWHLGGGIPDWCPLADEENS